MTINEQTLLAKMMEVYGDDIADPDIYPSIFHHQANVTLYYMRQNEQQRLPSDPSEQQINELQPEVGGEGDTLGGGVSG